MGKSQRTMRPLNVVQLGLLTVADIVAIPDLGGPAPVAVPAVRTCGIAALTTGLRLPGIRTAKTPPKNFHADLQPTVTATNVCASNVNHTNMWRL